MSILKLKISRVVELKKLKREQTTQKAEREEIKSQKINKDRPQRIRKPVTKLEPLLVLPSKASTSSNNIMKNYSQVLTKFARSDIAVSYLKSILADSRLTVDQFTTFIQSKKGKVNCIKGLREMLLIYENDSEEIVCLKKAFKQISIIFLKFFCVNWIFHSRIAEKIVHLRYRFKILRRIKNPEHFTYLEGFAEFK